MQAKQLMEQFALIADAPQGIQRLREMILQLAVQGKLVPQEPTDEPAAVLLAKIQAEKERLIKQGTIKRQKPLPPIQEDEKPFELPNGWEFCRFDNLITSVISGGTPSKNNPSYWNGNIPWASVKDLGKSLYLYKTQDYITQKGLDAGSKLANVGDLLICTRMGLGKIAIASVDVAFNQDLKAVKLSSFINIKFFLHFFATLKFKGTGTTVAGIKQEELLSTLVAIPPEKEQARIVAKVDALMALCDELEALQQKRAQLEHNTLNAVLDSLANAQTPIDLHTAWQRLQAAMPRLFTQPQQIKGLRDAILQLAVRGKLVPQEPNDEPASVLLEKINAEKERLIKEGKIKRQKPLPPIREEEIPFELPQGWEWVRLGEICNKITDGTHHSPPNYSSGDFLYITAKNIKNDGVLLDEISYVTQDVHNEIYARCDPELGDVLYIKDGATTGIATVNNISKPFSMLSSVALFKLPKGFINSYLLISLRAPLFYIEMRAEMTGVAITRVTLKKLNLAIIPLPPEKEQERIVAKVNSLMALCDELEARLQAARHTQEQFALAAVALS